MITHSDIFDHEIERAIKTIGRSSDPVLYWQALAEFRSGRGIAITVSFADVKDAARIRGLSWASQRDEQSAWEEILASDLARATYPARSGTR